MWVRTSQAAAGESGPPSVAGGARARDRLAARFLAHSLDQALAAGAPPEATPALALRARRLIALPYRRSIANAYCRIVSEAQHAGRPFRLSVVPNPTRVATASAELIRLVEALTRTGPVAPRGVAEARLLLADGTGPLYDTGSEASLRECVARAAGDLELSGGTQKRDL